MRLDSKFYQIAVTIILSFLGIILSVLLITVLFFREFILNDFLFVFVLFILHLIFSLMINKNSCRVLLQNEKFTFRSLILNRKIAELNKVDFRITESLSNTRYFGYRFMRTYVVEFLNIGKTKKISIVSNIDLIEYIKSCNFTF